MAANVPKALDLSDQVSFTPIYVTEETVVNPSLFQQGIEERISRSGDCACYTPGIKRQEAFHTFQSLELDTNIHNSHKR